MAKKTENLEKNTAKSPKKSVFQVNLEKNIQNIPQVKSSGRGWQKFGRRDDFPYILLDLYNNSPTLRGAVGFCVSALIGNGIILDDDTQSMPNAYEDWNSLIRKISMDYFIMGSYAIQIILNRDRKTYSFYHQDISTVRCGERDKDGLITEYYISRDFTSPNKAGNEPIAIPSFVMRPDEEYKLKAGQPYLYVLQEYTPQIDTYWLPCWYSSIKAVQSECEYLQYDYSTACNSFLASGILSFAPSADDAERESIVQQVKDTFIGSNNSARLMVVFRNDSDNDSPVQFTKFATDQGEFDLFSTANERAISRILEGFSIPSRLLIGLPEQNAGFSSEGQLLETALNVYQTIAGKHYRNIVLNTINNLFKMNGIDVKLEVEDIKFDISGNKSEKEVKQDISEENIIEQEN